MLPLRPLLVVAAAALFLLPALSGCPAQTNNVLSVSPATGKLGKPASAVPKARAALSLQVNGPMQLVAEGGGHILTDAGAGLIRGGQILTDAGAGLVSKSKFSLLAMSTDAFAPVEAAGIQALDKDGKPVGAVVETDAAGRASLKGLPEGQRLSVFAAFRTGGKVYRLAASLSKDAKADTLVLDPINTMVEARVRDILAGKEAPASLTNTRLARVWTICNKAAITLEPEQLEAGRPIDELTAALNAAWKAAIASSVTDAGEKGEIASFIADLESAKNAK